MRIVVILHNVRSVHNVGAMFRTADAAGVERVFLSGYTPAPIDRFGRERRDMAKAALGAERSVPWEHRASAAEIIDRLRSEGWRVVGVEQDARAIDYRTAEPREKIAFVFGNEVRGLSRQLRDRCDELVEIPMHGVKESLNVSVTVGVILFDARRGR